jgi:hypothetical protein
MAAAQTFPSVAIVGATAVPVLEGWILALSATHASGQAEPAAMGFFLYRFVAAAGE